MSITILEKLAQAQNRHMGRLEFFKESIRNIKSVGTVTRSSRFLSKSTVAAADVLHADTILELGAGDGVMTHFILNDMKPDARLFAFEINEVFFQQLSEIDDSRLTIVNESADNLKYYVNNVIQKPVDVIISALPFSVFPEELAYSIVKQCFDVLKPDGLFVQIHYSLKVRKIYRSVFGNVVTKFEPLNIPPAFVLKSKKLV